MSKINGSSNDGSKTKPDSVDFHMVNEWLLDSRRRSYCDVAQAGSGEKRALRGTLRNQTSRLDLIDDTRLTSLPFPPPPKARRRKEVAEDALGGDIDGAVSVVDVSIDDSIDEQEDPIVLVEDYLTPKHAFDEKTYLCRKRSLAMFKQVSYQKQNSTSSSLVTLNSERLTQFEENKRTVSTGSTLYSEGQAPCKGDNLEEIFGKLPGSGSLKYCDICEKPLYEISTLVNSVHPMRCNTEDSSAACEPCPLFSEFVCWECMESYDEYVNGLQEFESIGKSPDTTPKSSDHSQDTYSRLFSIFESINNKYGRKPVADGSHLANCTNSVGTETNLGLAYNSYAFLAKNSRSSTNWIHVLRYKLRWRWRLSGLLHMPITWKHDTD
ncbi:Piso0_000866 [Millerozyma farinosa CBS 7064]|uniref:Piso0_000866 protein n=1 Tax=Pichia sorbitophila (strain ATCC MYA-4447 / BCRC 22081 / CBS 7064 / NBRC 10061 / NRRL Y-12695) TaxID=559304 RepID=G8YQ99_PICSO|nr:Piso0_000866 [Millerozyma farinosa CBS 7064]